jgi:hypothetical protein
MEQPLTAGGFVRPSHARLTEIHSGKSFVLSAAAPSIAHADGGRLTNAACRPWQWPGSARMACSEQ